MRKLLGFLFALVALAVVVIVAVPFLVSTQWIRDQVTAAVREQTGRELTIAGDTSLSVFPDIALVVSHAALSNPQGREGTFANMEELDLGLKLMPLLSGKVEVDHFIVTRPVISLEIDEVGAANWSLAPPVGAAPADTAELDGEAAGADVAPAEPSAAGSLPAIELIQVGDMRIVDGVVTLEDRRTGSFHEVREINAEVELSSLDEPLEVSGTLGWQGEQVGFRLALAEPRALATGTASGAAFDIDSTHLQADFSGSLAAKEGILAEGDLELSTPSLKDLARWLGSLPPRIDGLGAFTARGQVKAGQSEIALSGAQVTLDGTSAEGGLLISLGRAKPLIQATLAADRIDMNRYLGTTGATEAAAPSPSTAGAPGGAAAASADGWDADPIDVSGLSALDADLRLSTRELLFRSIRAGQSALAVTLRDSVLTVDLSELQLYEGRAAGKLTVNATGEMPAIAASFAVDGVAARSILTDAASLEWLEGRGHITGSLASRGVTEQSLVEALNGEMSVRFTDGAIRGFNIAQMVRSLQGGAVFDWSREAEQKTDFSELSASFTVVKGIAQTDNLQMLGPLVRLAGVGVANLPQRSVDFRITPKIVASLEGQGGAGELSGVEVPFLISGPWDRPSITPDLAAVLRDPQSALDAVEQIGRSLDDLRQDGALEEAVGTITRSQPREFLDLFMGGGGTPAAGTPEAGDGAAQVPPPIPEDVFNQLLGR